MPQGENFWNPYRWVTVSPAPDQLNEPSYHHRYTGMVGRLHCELTALTPFLIGDGQGNFVRRAGNIDSCYVPGTSLKGAIRSLVEVISASGTPWRPRTNGSRLDVATRIFGHLQGGDVLRGLVRFSDAQMVETPTRQWSKYDIVVGQPKKQHQAFYPGQEQSQRKFYHHHPGASSLVKPDPGITQTTTVQPAPVGTRFVFAVDFANLRESELDLLLYSLALEERVEVTLSPQALGAGIQPPVTIQGPLRHKLGGAKPQGAGSVHIRIAKMRLDPDPAARYQGKSRAQVWKAASLEEELHRRIQPFQTRTDQTMQELRSMLVYSERDPRRPIRYPSREWFGKNSSRKLKPTL